MTPEEAHHLLRRSSAPFDAAFTDFVYDNDPRADGFTAAEPEEQTRLRDAAELLVTTGRSHYTGYQTHAGVVLGFPMEPDRLTRLVTHYRVHRLDDTAELGGILLGQFERLTTADLDVLQDIFAADPGRQVKIGTLVMRRRCAGPAWDALVANLRSSQDPSWLAAVCEMLVDPVTALEARLSVWYLHMRAKPLHVREATADRVTARPWGLRAELGLEP